LREQTVLRTACHGVEACASGGPDIGVRVVGEVEEEVVERSLGQLLGGMGVEAVALDPIGPRGRP